MSLTDMEDWQIHGQGVAPRHMHMLVSSMSARGRAIEVGPRVVHSLREGGWEVTVSVTTAEDTPRKVAEASSAPFVAALGGDGYLAQVAQGVKNTGSIFVPFPGGRGNDLCRALKISHDPFARARDLASLGASVEAAGDASSDALSSRVRNVDALWVHEEGRAPTIVLGILSVGYEAAVNEIANDSWFRSGPLAYGYGALAAFSRYEERQIRALVDGQERDLSGWVASVSNSGMFGGGIHFVPTSDLSDACMELVHVGSVSRSVAIRTIVALLCKRNVDHPLVSVTQAKEISFTAPVGTQAWADGDPVATIPFTIRLEPGAIRTLT